ncbi:MAG: hypothetical protein OFPII_11280 [Osedax symbiont Rs1]|nr:MAG: hypothetical protein OFPII_11280 [Osedax symbiont Rs1]
MIHVLSMLERITVYELQQIRGSMCEQEYVRKISDHLR